MWIITGMHRSGTSLVARLFFEAGADLGNPETFYRPDRWNPGGYFEQPEIHAVNMPLINGRWGKWAYLRLPSTQKILARSQKYAGEIVRLSRKYENRVVKETRFCLTLPAWLKHGTYVQGILICLREPNETAHSIHQRNWVPVSFALKLWLTHYERLLEQAQAIPLWFVHYNRLLDQNDSCDEIDAAFRFARLIRPKDEIFRLIQTFVKPEMNKNRGARGVSSSDVEKMWQSLVERHQKQFAAVRA